MDGTFFIVGPTAVGKSELAAEVAVAVDAEIVSADAFQVYRGLELLTAKPSPELLQMVPHHLVGAIGLEEEMNAERFRASAERALASIRARGKPALVVGGSGLYVRALTDGLSPLPPGDPALRGRLEQCSARELFIRLQQRDAPTAATIDRENRRRLVRALEICLLTGQPVSKLRQAAPPRDVPGVLVFREREELNERINQRVEAIFALGVVDEVRASGATSETAARTLGLAQIRALIAGHLTEAECIAQIQQATRRYAKRQLTWFRHQSTFAALNLTGKQLAESVASITQMVRRSRVIANV